MHERLNIGSTLTHHNISIALITHGITLWRTWTLTMFVNMDCPYIVELPMCLPIWDWNQMNNRIEWLSVSHFLVTQKSLYVCVVCMYEREKEKERERWNKPISYTESQRPCLSKNQFYYTKKNSKTKFIYIYTLNLHKRFTRVECCYLILWPLLWWLGGCELDRGVILWAGGQGLWRI